MQQPNYYGVPYPSQMDANMNQPPYPNMNGKPPYVSPENMPSRDANGVNPTNNSVDNAPSEGTYFTKVLAKHTGKNVQVYCSFTDAADWHDRVFEGVLIDSGDDYVILEERKIKKQILILSVYIHFIEFDN